MIEKLKTIFELLQLFGGYPSWVKLVWVLTLILVGFSFILFIVHYPRKISDLARNAWHAGMGYNSCFQEWTDKNRITSQPPRINRTKLSRTSIAWASEFRSWKNLRKVTFSKNTHFL